MGRLNDAWNALIGRTNARNRRANGEAQSGTQRPTGGNSFNYPTIGTGLTPWAPGAQTDYTKLAGVIRDNAVVSICLSWIRRQIAQGCLQLGTYDPDDNTYEPLEDTAAGVTSQVLPLLRRPNATYSWRATLGATSDCLVVDGNAYWLKLRDFSGLGSTRELWWVPNGQIQVERETRFGSARLVRRYWYTRDGVGGWEPWEPEDVIHFRDGIDPDFPWMGLSALKRQVRNIAGVNAGESYTAAVLRNRHAGKILVPKAVMSGGMVGPEPDEKEMAAEKRALEHATENENAGRIHAATIAVDVVDLGMGPQEMALDQILDRPEGMVIASCGLNGMVLNVPSSHDTRTYSNWGEARRDAWESGVMPLQDLIAEELTHQLVFTSNSDGKVISEYGLPEGAMLYWERKDVSALREDADARTTRSTALFTSTVLPRNRALAEGGFDPIEDEEQGEAYYGDPSPMAQDQQDQMMGSADSSIDEMDPSFDPEAEADLTGDESNVEDTTDSVKARMGGVRKGMKKKVKPVKPIVISNGTEATADAAGEPSNA